MLTVSMSSILSFLTGYLGSCARIVIERERPLIIALTGSVGKSTSRQCVGAVLAAAHDYRDGLRVPTKNYNNQLGVPLTIFALPAPGRSPARWAQLLWRATCGRFGLWRTGAKTFVLEMGADHPGDIAYLTSLARPSISVVTAVTPEDPNWAPVHAANYPTINDLAHEKATLVRALPAKGTMVLNADDARVLAMRSEAPTAHLVTFGTSEAADVRILSMRIRTKDTSTGAMPTGLEVELRLLQQTQTVVVEGVFGRSVAYALAASAAVGLALDISTAEMAEGWKQIRPLPGRTRLIPGTKGTMLFDDSYNASPVAVLAALRDLASVQIDQGAQRTIACLGEMRELGPSSDTLHAEIGKQAAQLGIDLLAVTGAFAEAYRRGAIEGGMNEEQIRMFGDTPELGEWVQDILRPGDLVLAKASEGGHHTKGVRMERVIKELMADPAQAETLLCRQELVWQTRA